MKHLNSILLVFVCLLSAPCFCQINFVVPAGYELKVKADYDKYESSIIEATKWLEATDLDKEKEKRQEINRFLIQWITGSPTVTVELYPRISKLIGRNEQLLSIYMAGYTRYQHEI